MPLNLNLDDSKALFLLKKVTADFKHDISTTIHVFPMSRITCRSKEREPRQIAEPIIVRGQPS